MNKIDNNNNSRNDNNNNSKNKNNSSNNNNKKNSKHSSNHNDDNKSKKNKTINETIFRLVNLLQTRFFTFIQAIYKERFKATLPIVLFFS